MIRNLRDKLKNNYPRPHDHWQEVPVGIAALGDSEGQKDGRVDVRKVRSLRSKRKIFTLACTAFSIGALLIVLGSPYDKEFLAPGPLCSSHAQILAGQGADRCAACHGAADRTVVSWLSDALTGGTTINVSQSDLCMKCHQSSINSSVALNPHNLAPAELQERSKKFQQASFVSRGIAVGSPVNHAHEIACSACHREHHGKADLKVMTDQQCQSCHSQVYHSFETDHPEFTNWPQQRRSRIAFDHSTHAGKHFPGKQTEFNCSQCHVDDNYRNVKMLASFEKTCAQCHQQAMDDSYQSGLALFALPMIDTDAIEQHQQDIGSWPLAATGDFDGPIPPVMRLLLCGEPEAAEILDRLGSRFGFSDVDPDDAQQVADAAQLVWSIKRLLHDLSNEGQAAMQKRLGSALNRSIAMEQMDQLANQLDQQVFQNVVRRWLPDLERELANRAQVSGMLGAQDDFPAADAGGSRWSTPTTRTRNASVFRLVKYDDRLLAPNPLQGLIDGSRVDDLNEASAAAEQRSQVADSGANSELRPEQSTTPGNRAKPMVLNEGTPSLSDDSERLAINPLSTADPAGSLSNESRDQPNVGSLAADANHQPTAPDSAPAATNWPRRDFAGWYRDDQTFRIAYRPRGHDDSCVKEWSELAAATIAGDQNSATASLFRRTLAATGIGLCSSCHTVDQLSDDSFAINWKAEYRDPSIRDFTRFSHGPHTLQPHLQDCSHCHDKANPVSNKDSFVGYDSSVAVSNFAPITKVNCASCHREGQTDNSCTHCHNYHVGSVASPGN